MKKLKMELIWFLLVGSAAASVHWLLTVTLVELADIRTYVANMIGWSIAFLVSFSGHYTLTFRHLTKKLMPTIWRFACISIGGFLINEFAFVMIINRTSIPYDILLAIILMGIATLTFVLSRYWAFRHK